MPKSHALVAAKFSAKYVRTQFDFITKCLFFQDESSVQSLIDACIQDEDKLYLCVSSPTIKDKPVQIRPWRLSDADFDLDASLPLDPRKTVFVGGVPRPLKAGKFKCRHNYLSNQSNTVWFNAGVFAITLT